MNQCTACLAAPTDVVCDVCGRGYCGPCAALHPHRPRLVTT